MTPSKFEKRFAVVACVASIAIAGIAVYAGGNYIAARLYETRDIKWVALNLLLMATASISAAYPVAKLTQMTRLGAWLNRWTHQ